MVGVLWQYLHDRVEETGVFLESPHLQTAIRVEVLNGCGAPKAAARLTKRARSLGIDVIHEGDAESFDFLQTMVLDRSGDMNKALQVAMVLGIPHCIQQIIEDSFRLADVSIIIGHDHRQLNLLDHE